MTVQYFDAKANLNRKFISVQDTDTHLRSYHLYEVVLRGEVSVLRRDDRYASAQLSDGNDYRYSIQYDDVLYSLQSFRASVYPGLVQKGGAELLQFIHRQRINPNHAADAIRIIKQYNTICQQQLLAKS
jgi:hypothetical protein